jgi:hypothetical protein
MTDTLGFPRWTQDVTWSTTGDWTTNYPIANLGILPFAKVARSSNPRVNSTLFRGDYSKPRLTEIVVLCRHNLTLDAKWRVCLYEQADDDTPVYESGFLDVWPIVFDATQVTWDSGNFWDRKYTQDQIDGYPWFTPLYIDGAYTAAAFTVEISDPTNPDGYVQVGLCEVASALDFPIGLAFGAQVGFTAATVITAADGGVEYAERRQKPRSFVGALSAVDRSTALTTFYELQRLNDLDVPFFWWPDREDTQHALRLAYMARLQQLDALSQAYFQDDAIALHFKEIL